MYTEEDNSCKCLGGSLVNLSLHKFKIIGQIFPQIIYLFKRSVHGMKMTAPLFSRVNNLSHYEGTVLARTYSYACPRLDALQTYVMRLGCMISNP